MRSLLALLAVIGVTASALAQGTVNFNNNVTFATPGDRLVRCGCDCPGPPCELLVGTQFVAQLYYGTQGTPQESLTPVASPPAQFRAVTTSYPGTWRGGTRTLEGILPGQTATLQVRVWNGSLFPTYEAAMANCAAGGWGMSAQFDYTVPPDGSPSASYFMESFRGFHFFFPYDPPSFPPVGTVNFHNNVSFLTRADRLVRDSLGAPLVGTNFVAQLYYGPTSDDLRPVTDAPAAFFPPTTTTPGTWSGGTRVLWCYRSGTTVWLQVRVWDRVQFPTYEGAVAGGGVHAQSCPFTYTIPGSGAAPSEFFMENFPGIPGPLDCSAGWFSWGTSDNPPSGNRLLILAHVNVGVWRATNLNQPSWQAITTPATLRIPMTNQAMFFKVERSYPPPP